MRLWQLVVASIIVVALVLIGLRYMHRAFLIVPAGCETTSEPFGVKMCAEFAP